MTAQHEGSNGIIGVNRKGQVRHHFRLYAPSTTTPLQLTVLKFDHTLNAGFFVSSFLFTIRPLCLFYRLEHFRNCQPFLTRKFCLGKDNWITRSVLFPPHLLPLSIKGNAVRIRPAPLPISPSIYLYYLYR